VSRFDRLSLLAVTAVAALLRLPGIAARGAFDADQGHDMLTLMAFTRDGVVPLLGPKTSVADFHHGAFYYFLMAPAAAISNDDPVIVTAWIAILGIAAVMLTWWFARSIGGPLAGALAGLLLAISPAAIDESTFIWNPNPIAFFAVLAMGAAWKGHVGARVTADAAGTSMGGAAPVRTSAAWWAIAIGAAGAVTQLHVLGVVFLAAIGVLALLELRSAGPARRSALLGILGGAVLVFLLFVPLLVHELRSDFSETRLMLDYLLDGGSAQAANPALALAFTLFRVVGWPLVGLVTDVPAAAGVLVAIVIGLIGIWDLRARGSAQRTALWWLAGILAWSTVALAFAAPSLQTVVAGLPNDHYHAFVDPIVVILIAVPVAGMFEAAVARWRANPTPVRAVVPAVLGVGVALLAIGMLSRKPAPDPNGGWPAMQAAGERVAARLGEFAVSLRSEPRFKLSDALGFPVAYAGGLVSPGERFTEHYVAIVCDRLFDAVQQRRCGGPAEDFRIGLETDTAILVDRFDASPRTVISVYEVPDR